MEIYLLFQLNWNRTKQGRILRLLFSCPTLPFLVVLNSNSILRNSRIASRIAVPASSSNRVTDEFSFTSLEIFDKRGQVEILQENMKSLWSVSYQRPRFFLVSESAVRSMSSMANGMESFLNIWRLVGWADNDLRTSRMTDITLIPPFFVWNVE